MGRKRWIRPRRRWYSLDALIRLTRQTVLLAILLGTTSPAFAADTGPQPSAADIATARDLFRQGARLAQQEDWEAALDAYQRSMALRPSNLTRYSIAVVQERLGKLVEAMETLRVFLAQDHDRSTFRYVQPAREMLEALEQRIARVKVVIPGNPRGARVLIDGVAIPDAAIGVYRPTDPGKRRVEARVPGYPTFVQTVDLDEGGEAEVVVRLRKPGDPVSAPGGPAPVTEPAAEHERDDTAGTVLVAAGGGVFALGLGLGIYGYTKAKDAEASEGSDADSARTFALVGDIGMGVGLVAAGIGTYMLLSGDEKESDQKAGLSVGPWGAPGSAGVVASGRF